MGSQEWCPMTESDFPSLFHEPQSSCCIERHSLTMPLPTCAAESDTRMLRKWFQA